jgi:hypothetical protein
MRPLCATLIALCLVTAGSPRAPHPDGGGDRRTPTVDTTPLSVTPAVKLRRRAVMPDAGLGPVAVTVVSLDLVPPRHALRLAGSLPRCTPPEPHRRSHPARGPPRA